eukprot:939291-Ditylum_brightwellii.AAC.1
MGVQLPGTRLSENIFSELSSPYHSCKRFPDIWFPQKDRNPVLKHHYRHSDIYYCLPNATQVKMRKGRRNLIKYPPLDFNVKN